MVRRIIKTYLTIFAIFYSGYSLFNWLLTTKMDINTINEDLSNFWLPFAVVYIPTFFFLRPLVLKTSFRKNIKDGLLWALFPISIAIPTALSQKFFKVISYRLVPIEEPGEVHSYPKENFFQIKKFYVNRNEFSLFKERQRGGGKGRSLKVNNYYIAPLYSDSSNLDFKVAYALKFATSISYGLLSRDEAPERIERFNRKTAGEFANYDLYNVQFFERPVNSDDKDNLGEAWRQNQILNNNENPIVLLVHSESFARFMQIHRNTAIFSVLISLTVTIGLLFVFQHFRTRQAE